MSKAPSFAHSAYPGDGATVRAGGSRAVWPMVAAGLLWLAAGLSAGYWVLQALGRAPVTPVPAAAMAPQIEDSTGVARALGAAPVASEAIAAAAPAASRYSLKGVAAVGTQRGAALIAVDAQPPVPYRVGATIEGGLVVQAVTGQEVRLGPAVDGPASVTLVVPELPVAGR